ncbi:MAG TPA: 4-hydroxy-tetrahydrodipicolinate synthase [Tenuifilaceae bacterium]|nr:4-hydroxy-tetrahydrodipicolinate synthase [Tenuifilaceae bacterium]HPJ46638.1 4-hydroxy-tetrahydrodipicolinate synthase [Tenuifilaceae bacterium]HPQ33506.1 4-hydroxy-tetrahydrodipicolinate synthase [Tenuifilaceae bacterium]
MSSMFKGLGVAMVTPFDSRKEIDYEATEKLLEHLVSGGVNYLVLQGTTGESVTLSDDEKHDFIQFVLKKNDGRLPVVVGMGGNNTSNIAKKIKDFDFDGIDAILSVTPYYNKPTQKGLELHYRALAAQSPVPIILYNVPGRTGVNMTADTTLKLAHEVPNIIAVKEASGNLNQQTYILRDRPEGFLVLSGDDGLAFPQIAMGMDGVISVVGNAFPKQFSTLVHHALNGNIAEAKELHYNLIELIDTLFVEGNPGGIKAALEILGIIENNLRLPLAPISESAYYKLSILIENM